VRAHAFGTGRAPLQRLPGYAVPTLQIHYFGFAKQDLELSSHFLSDIFSHSACVGGLGGDWVCAKATVATLRAATVIRAFMDCSLGYT
jgi:hypothetical protein